jgi:pimeloyl-ACP methyl ester carboxylesterase
VASPPSTVSEPRWATSRDGVAIAVHHLAGDGTGRPLLVAHATGFNAGSYRPLGTVLAADFDVWAADLRGHGASSVPPGSPVDWDLYGDDADAAVDAVPHAQPIVGFGHSMGGASLLVAASRRPERFAGLVLFEPIVIPPERRTGPSENHLAMGARRRRRQFDSVDAAYANFASKRPMNAFDPAALRGYVDDGFRPVDPRHPDGPVELTCDPAHEADTFEASTRHPLWERLADIKVPVAVVAGRTDDGELPAELAPAIAAELPNGTAHSHPELDHFGPFTNPAALSAIVRDAVSGWT